jgi:hypothetical protein
MSEIMTMKPRLHLIFSNDNKFGVRNLFAGIVLLGTRKTGQMGDSVVKISKPHLSYS